MNGGEALVGKSFSCSVPGRRAGGTEGLCTGAGGGGPWDGGSGQEDGLGCIGWARMGGGPDGQWEIWGGASLESEPLNRLCVGQWGGGGDEGAPFGERDSTCVAGIAT